MPHLQLLLRLPRARQLAGDGRRCDRAHDEGLRDARELADALPFRQRVPQRLDLGLGRSIALVGASWGCSVLSFLRERGVRKGDAEAHVMDVMM